MEEQTETKLEDIKCIRKPQTAVLQKLQMAKPKLENLQSRSRQQVALSTSAGLKPSKFVAFGNMNSAESFNSLSSVFVSSFFIAVCLLYGPFEDLNNITARRATHSHGVVEVRTDLARTTVYTKAPGGYSLANTST